MVKLLMVANWKMNKTVKEAEKFFDEFIPLIKNKSHEVIICPPFTALAVCAEQIKNTSVKLGAQDVFYEEQGAFTGQVAPKMVKEFAKYVILGHSERRALGETNEMVNKKIRAALQASLIPILCVGETIEERDEKHTKKVIEYQLQQCLKGLEKSEIKKVIITYEPVWAISANKQKGVATIAQIDEAHSFIEHTVQELFGDVAEKVKILYGGSVNEENVHTFLEKNFVAGFLIGSASLEPQSFAALANLQ